MATGGAHARSTATRDRIADRHIALAERTPLYDVERRACVIADNRLAEKAGWDRDLLAIEFQDLLELGFDVGLTGFELGEIELIFQDAAERKAGAHGPKTLFPELPRALLSA